MLSVWWSGAGFQRGGSRKRCCPSVALAPELGRSAVQGSKSMPYLNCSYIHVSAWVGYCVGVKVCSSCLTLTLALLWKNSRSYLGRNKKLSWKITFVPFHLLSFFSFFHSPRFFTNAPPHSVHRVVKHCLQRTLNVCNEGHKNTMENDWKAGNKLSDI